MLTIAGAYFAYLAMVVAGVGVITFVLVWAAEKGVARRLRRQAQSKALRAPDAPGLIGDPKPPASRRRR